MKKLIGSIVFASSFSVFAQESVTEVPHFQCHAKGANLKYSVLTEEQEGSLVLTVGTLNDSGVEKFESFKAVRTNEKDQVRYQAKELDLSLTIANDFDGEFFSAELLKKEKDGSITTQELSCEGPQAAKISASATSSLKASENSLSGYYWTCSSAPYNNYNYRWFYWQNYNINFAKNQAVSLCNNFYGAPICGFRCY